MMCETSDPPRAAVGYATPASIAEARRRRLSAGVCAALAAGGFLPLVFVAVFEPYWPLANRCLGCAALLWIAAVVTAWLRITARRPASSALDSKKVAVLSLVAALAGFPLAAVIGPGAHCGCNPPWLRSLSNLKSLGTACWSYAMDTPSQSFPPDLQVLAEYIGDEDGESIRSPGWSAGPMPACGYYYVPSVRHDDPSHWILAFDDPNFFGGKRGSILRVDGSATNHKTVSNGGDFEKVLWEFLNEYLADRGELPVILPPK
jgi:hypothetical protein